MLWLNFAATIIILGAIVNAVVDEYLSGDKEKQPSFEQRLFRWFKRKINGFLKSLNRCQNTCFSL